MYEEIAPRRRGAFRSVFLTVLVGFVALSLPNWLSSFETVFQLPYAAGLYQLAVFLLITLLVLRFLRRYSVEYRYKIVDTVVTVTEKVGARQNIVFQGTLSAESRVLPLRDGKKILEEKGLRLSRVGYGISDPGKATLVTFPTNPSASVAVFQVSEQFVEIMSQKVLDKRSEI